MKGERMKMNITEWANKNGLTPEQFIHELVNTIGAIGAMELDEKGDESDLVAWTIQDNIGLLQVMVRRVREKS
jgi:hypothetical protein